MLDVGLELCIHPFFLLLMQTVTTAPHRVPVMNATREQTIAVMAVAAAGDRLLSGVYIPPFSYGKRPSNY